MGRKSLEGKDIDITSKKRLDLGIKSFPYFQKMGVKAFKMDDLAKLLNKSKTTIYKYFVGREDLVEFIISWKLKELTGYKEYLFNEELDYIERYKQAIDHIGRVLAGISNKFLLEVSEVYPELWGEVNNFRLEAGQNMGLYYQEGTKLGVFKNINPRILLMTDQQFFESLMSEAFLTQGQMTVQQALNDYFQLKCYGMVEKP